MIALDLQINTYKIPYFKTLDNNNKKNYLSIFKIINNFIKYR